MKRLPINFSAIAVLAAAWLTLAYSAPLLESLNAYHVSTGMQLKFLIFIFCFYGLILSLSRALNLFKPIVIILIMMAAPIAYFMQQYGILIDADMLINTLETDPAEASDQLSAGLFFSIVLWGIVPSLLLSLVPLPTVWSKVQMSYVAVSVVAFSVISVGIAYTNYDEFASLFRNQRDVKYRVVPFNAISAGVSVLKQSMQKPHQFIVLAEDARQFRRLAKPRVMVVVVGETVRADHLALNGYARPTTPKLSALAQSESLLSFTNAQSCGTATAVSVPCMFSLVGAENYSPIVRQSTNVLDVLVTAGLQVTWVENNSGCKDVCNRVNTITLDKNRCANSVCYDIEMLDELKNLLTQVRNDSVIVLHQMGSHGPAYFERSPQFLKQFLPECKSSVLSDCTQQEIINAYDNSLLVTDQLISEVISVLQSYDNFDSSLMYVSDHGESLGDNGIYLHGLPNWLAPREQRHVAWLAWPAEQFSALPSGSAEITHDNFSHTVLGYFNVATEVYIKGLDLTQHSEVYAHAPATP